MFGIDLYVLNKLCVFDIKVKLSSSAWKQPKEMEKTHDSKEISNLSREVTLRGS